MIATAQTLRAGSHAAQQFGADLCQLESRVLMSASPVAAVAEVPAIDQSVVEGTAPTSIDTDQLTDSDAQTQAAAPAAHEVVFVDGDVHNYEELLADLQSQQAGGRPLNVYLLDAERDGIEQISDILAELSDVSAVHIVSHATNGSVKLGSTWLSETGLDGYAAQIAGWQAAFTSQADLLFYGCELANSNSGQTLLEAFAALTGADVAASTDNTGHVQYGGDWDLEFVQGTVDTEIVFGASVREDWHDLLGVITVSTSDDVLDGDTSSIAALLGNAGADGLISLREAIVATNNTAGADTIFLPAGTFTFTIEGRNEDAALTGDLDIADALTIIGAGWDLSIIDASGLDRVIDVRLGISASISDVMIRGGAMPSNAWGAGVLVDNGASLNLSHVIVAANSTGSGAGIYNYGTLVATDSIFSNNAASDWGGGLYNDRGNVTLDRVTISGNTAGKDGAGIYNTGAGAIMDLTNVTLSSNIAVGNGGGLFTSRTVTATNVTIAFNDAAAGDGVYGQGGTGSVTFLNSILHNPTGNNSNVAMVSLGHNLDSDGSSGLMQPTDLNGVDPLLDAALSSSGGNVPTYRLLAGSQAIDSGTTSAAPIVDARNVLRDAVPDIGAYETHGVLASTAEFLVNTTSSNTQMTTSISRGSTHAVALARDGSYVVVWSSDNQDGSGWGVYGQRFDAAGNELGGEFQINQESANDQRFASVAMDGRGDFVVTWTSQNQDGSNNGVYARQYTAAGIPLSSEFLVNLTTTSNQDSSAVSIASDGRFLIVWDGEGTGDTDGIFGRWYSSSGVPTSSEVRINTIILGAQGNPSVAMAPDGKAVVVWDDASGVHAQRFDASGAAVGGQFIVDPSLTAGNADVEMASDGSFAIVYRKTILDMGVYLQRYDSAGNSIGSPQIVNTSVFGDQTDPSIAMDDIGNFLIVWQGNGTGDSAGIHGRRYDASGNALGVEFLVNETTSGTQAMTSAAMLDSAHYVVVWSGEGLGDSNGVFARQFNGNVAPVITSDGGTPVVAVSIAENTNAVTTVTATDADLPAQALVYSISGGADAANFTINSATGVLRFISAPDFELPTDVGANNVYDVTLQVSDGILADTQSVSVTITNLVKGFWLSTAGETTGSGIPGLDSWSSGEVLLFGDPNLDLEPGTNVTSGTFYSTFNLQNFSSTANIDAIEYVTRTLTIGGGGDTLTLQAGDVLLSINASATLTSVNSMAVTEDEVFLFRPTEPGNYSSGTFLMVLDNFGLIHGGTGTESLALVEQTTTVGDVTLAAGTFLFSCTGTDENSDIRVFTPTGVGAGTTTGNVQVLVEGDDVGTAITKKIASLELVQGAMNIGGQALASGTILLSLETFGPVGINSLSVTKYDVAALSFSQTTLGSGSAVAVATLLINGSDVGLDSDAEGLDAMALYSSASNHAPAITSNGGGASANISVVENVTAVTTVLATDLDLPAPTLVYSISGGSDAGKFTINSVTGVLSFASAPDFEVPTDAGANNVYEVAVQVSDGSLVDEQAIVVSVANFIETPTVFLLDSTVVYAEQAAPLTIDSGLTIGNAGNANLTGATVTITGGSLPGPDELLFTSVAGISGSFDAAADTLTFTGTASVADYQAILRSVQFRNLSDKPFVSTRTLLFSVTDGSASGSDSRDLTVTAIDDPPMIDVGNSDLTFAAGGPALIIDAGLALSDADNLQLSGLTVRISANFRAGEDELTITPTGTISSSYDASTGVLTLTGNDTFANYASVLQTVAYRNSSAAPTTLPRTITFEVNDGTATATDSRVVLISATNSTPQIDPAAFSLAENSANGTLIGTATATDPDPATTFSDWLIVSGNTDGIFSINSGTGELTVANNANLDFEATSNYLLSLTVSDGNTTSAAAALSISVSDANDAVAGAPTITGTAQVGHLLTGHTSGISDEDGLGPMSYQWLSGGLAINGANSTSYVLNSMDIGHQISVRVSYTDGQGTPESVTSLALGPVAEFDRAPIVAPPPAVSHERAAEVEQSKTTNGDAENQGDQSNSASAAATSEVLAPFVTSPTDKVNLVASNPIHQESEVPRSTGHAEKSAAPGYQAGFVEDGSLDFSLRRSFQIISPTGIRILDAHTVVNALADFNFLSEYSLLWEKLDSLQESIAHNVQLDGVVMGSVSAVTSSLTVGYVVWMVRGGVIASTLLAQLPAWKYMDAMVVLAHIEEDVDDEDGSLESIVDQDLDDVPSAEEASRAAPQTMHTSSHKAK